MHPILFHLGSFPIHTYGLLVALGFLAGIFWIRYEAKRLNLPYKNRILDLVFYVILGGIVGARFFHIFFERSDFLEHPLDFFKVWEGGLVFHGGFLGSVIAGFFYLKKYKLPFWKTSDIFVIGTAIGHAFGRLGCLMAGCCHGKPTPPGSLWGITFPNLDESLAPSGIPLYPTQILESGFEVLIFFILVLFRKRKKFEGQVTLLYLMLYAVVRFFLEFLRGDAERGFFLQSLLGPSISNAQAVCVGFLIFALPAWLVLSKRNRLSSL